MLKGANDNGAEARLINVADAVEGDVKDVDYIAFGCPAMGSEELEDSQMRPFMDLVNPLLSGKNVVLFGSYEWAEGEWIKTWEDEVKGFGEIL